MPEKEKKKVYAFDGEKQKHLRYFSFFLLFVCCLSAFYGSACGEILRKTEVSCKLVPREAFARIEKKKRNISDRNPSCTATTARCF